MGKNISNLLKGTQIILSKHNKSRKRSLSLPREFKTAARFRIPLASRYAQKGKVYGKHSFYS